MPMYSFKNRKMITCKLTTQFKKSNIYEYFRAPCVPLSSYATLLPIFLSFVYHSLVFFFF